MAGLGLDDFLGHETNTSGGGGKYLSKWKKRQPAEVRLWLHTRALFVPLWQHGIPQVRTFEDRDTNTKVRKIWGGNFNCLEHETVLQQQNRRIDGGAREAPPEVCPMCLLVEYIRGLIAQRKLSKSAPIFRFDITDPGESPNDDSLRVLSAGAFCDVLKGDLTPTEKAELRKANISLQDAWRDNGKAKCSYIFSVVDHDNIDDGVQIAIETSLLGDKTKQVIRDQMKRLGRDEGNPLLNPYAFQWEHHPKEKEFSKKYHVIDMPRLAITPEIRELITTQDPPDLSRRIAPGNVRTLRAQLEQYALIDIPWDDLFGKAEATQANQQTEDDTDFAFGANVDDDMVAVGEAVVAEHAGRVAEAVSKADKAFKTTTAPASVAAPAPTPQPVAPAPAAQPVATSRRQKVDPPAPPPLLPEPMGDPCDDCGEPMKASQAKCTKCGAEYNITPEPAAAAPVTTTKAAGPAGTVLGADGVVGGSAADKLKW